MIRFVNIQKSFGSQHVLTGVNLEIPDQALYVIVGGSGVGKKLSAQTSDRLDASG